MAKRNARGDLANSNQKLLHSEMHSFYAAGAHAYANEYRSRFRSSRTRAMPFLRPPPWRLPRHAFSILPPDPWSQHKQGHVGNLRRVLIRKGGSEVSPFCAACRPGIVIYPVLSEVSSSVPPDGIAFVQGRTSSSSVPPDGMAFVRGRTSFTWRGTPSTITVCGLIISVTVSSWNLDMHR